MLSLLQNRSPSDWRPIAASVAFGVSVPIFFYTTYRIISNFSSNKFPSPSRDVPSVDSDCLRVCKWLAARNVSSDGVLLLARHGVDGRKLRSLTSHELKEMGLSDRDCKIIWSLLLNLICMGEKTESAEDANARPQKETPLNTTNLQSFPLNDFLSNAGHFIMEVMLPDSSVSESAASNHRAQMAVRLYKLLDHFQCLDIPDQKAAMLPLARQLNSFLASPAMYSPGPLHFQDRAREAVEHAPAHPPPRAPIALPQPKPHPEAIPEEIVKRVRPLHEMADKFIEILSSEQVRNTSNAEFHAPAKRIAEEITRVLQVADVLPPPLRDPLVLKCEKVLGMITTRLANKRNTDQDAPAEAVAQDPQAPTTFLHNANEAVSFPAAITRLLEVYEKVSSPEILKIEPAQRRKLIGECLVELRSIEAPLRASSDPQAIQSCEMFAQVYTILQRLHEVTEDEYLLSQKMPAQGAETAGKALAGAREELEGILKVVSRLQRENVSPEVRQAVEGQLRERLVELLESTASVPEAERKELRLHVTRILDLLPGPKQGSFEKAEESHGEDKFTGHDNAKEKKEEVKEEGEQHDDAESLQSGHIVAEAMNQIKRIFILLNSDRFLNSNPEEKRKLAKELLKSTHSAAEVLRSMGCDKALITRIVTPLEEILMENIESGSTPQPVSETNKTLTAIHDSLSSHMFQQSDRTDKLNLAKVLLPQLRCIEENLRSLPPLEQAATEKLLKSINHKLKGILNDAEPECPTSEPGADEPIAEEATTTPENPHDIMKRIEGVMNLIQSREFIETTMERRLVMVMSCISELKSIQERCEKLSPDVRRSLEPIVSQIHAQLNRIQQKAVPAVPADSAAPVEEAPTSPPAANAEDAGEPSTNADRKELFQMIAQLTRELRQGTTNNLELSDAELAPLWSLLEMVDSMGELSAEEVRLREDFETVLQLACQRSSLPGEGETDASSCVAAAASPPEQPQPQQSETEEGATEGGSMSILQEAIKDINSFILVFRFIRRSIEECESISIDQLVLFSDLVQKSLDTAAKRGVVWQENEEAVAAVKAVQESLTKVERVVSSQGGGMIMGIVERALSELEECPPKSNEVLQSYLQLYEECVALLSNSPEATELLNRLKTRIMEVGRDLNPTNDEDAASIEDRLSQALFDLSYRLREPNLSKEDLDECEKILDTWSDIKTDNPDFKEAIAAIRQQVELNRQSLEFDEEASSESNNDDGAAAEERKEPLEEEKAEPYPAASGVAFTEDDVDSVTDQVEPRVTVKPSPLQTYDHIPGGLENELTLLPKIEACIQKPTEQFVSSCNLFDIQSISKVLLHISSNMEKHPELQSRINAAKVKFLSKLQAFEVAEAPSQDVQASHHLQVTVEDTTDESGLRSYHFIVFHADEAETYPTNEVVMGALRTPANATRTEVGEAAVQDWAGRSTALIILGWDSSVSEGTALSELVVLQEVLTRRYGFDVVCVTGPTTDAARVVDLLTNLVAVGGLSRLFVFYHTPRPAAGVSVPQAMTFHDDSVLEHRRVLELTAGVARVVVVHSMPRRLEVIARLGETVSPAMSVLVTSAAAKEVTKVRCLLYEGLFTPIVVELLCRDEGNMLCPEDLVNYAITAMTRLTIEFGSFLKNEAASMGYFVPIDE
ncbi:unnamed protein product [Phytomonas sp. EM1]|nr:unnamed protein product [Phytomonas sp. EM1]|eukprot:CCW59747.1 unnamed protein product [Phytomonas sp. isolate EM1]